MQENDESIDITDKTFVTGHLFILPDHRKGLFGNFGSWNGHCTDSITVLDQTEVSLISEQSFVLVSQ